jgi:hypothetical protein
MMSAPFNTLVVTCHDMSGCYSVLRPGHQRVCTAKCSSTNVKSFAIVDLLTAVACAGTLWEQFRYLHLFQPQPWLCKQQTPGLQDGRSTQLSKQQFVLLFAVVALSAHTPSSRRSSRQFQPRPRSTLRPLPDSANAHCLPQQLLQ